MKESMTIESQERVLSSRIPYYHVPCTLQNPMVQEKAVPEHEKFPQNISHLFILNDSVISPDTTGITNKTKVKLQSSPRNTFQFNSQKPQNSSTKKFIRENYDQYPQITRESYSKSREKTNFSLLRGSQTCSIRFSVQKIQ
jgi:hypothetical protein